MSPMTHCESEQATENTRVSVFDLASVSKQFTGFAAALLIDRGELSLDDPVRLYVPELPEYGTPLLIRHLIYHTSGLRNFYALLRLRGVRLTDAITQNDALDMLRAQREINFEPGTEFLYSNSGYVLLATIVERVSGRPFPQFMREEIFAPLGMTNAFVIDDYERIVSRRVESYWRTSGGELRKMWAPLTAYGGRGVFSSAEDLARWLDNLERPRVGGERVVRLMHQSGELDRGEPLGYGFGLDVAEYRGLGLVGHAGDGLGFRTYVGRVPEHGLGVVVLGNGPGSPDPAELALRVIELFLDEHMAGEPAYSLDPDAMRRLAGDWISDGGYRVQLVLAGDRMFGEVLGGPLFPLTQLPDSTFTGMIGSSFRVSFDPDAEGPVERGTLSLYGTQPLRRAAAAEPSDRWHPAPEELEEYAGVYHSPEIESSYVVAVDDGHLVARHRRNADEVLRPDTRDVFSGVQGPIEAPRFIGTASFERDEHGAVTGMRVSAFRLRGLLFERMAGTELEDREWWASLLEIRSAGLELAVVDLRRIRLGGAVAEWFREPRPTRHSGGGYNERSRTLPSRVYRTRRVRRPRLRRFDDAGPACERGGLRCPLGSRADVACARHVPADAVVISYGLFLAGDGSAWIDDGSIEVVHD